MAEWEQTVESPIYSILVEVVFSSIYREMTHKILCFRILTIAVIRKTI